MTFKFNVMVFLYRAEESDEKRYTQVDGYPVDDGDDHELFAAELGDNR